MFNGILRGPSYGAVWLSPQSVAFSGFGSLVAATAHVQQGRKELADRGCEDFYVLANFPTPLATEHTEILGDIMVNCPNGLFDQLTGHHHNILLVNDALMGKAPNRDYMERCGRVLRDLKAEGVVLVAAISRGATPHPGLFERLVRCRTAGDEGRRIRVEYERFNPATGEYDTVADELAEDTVAALTGLLPDADYYRNPVGILTQ